MDNKGFTLVEMLAVAVVLTIVMGIGYYGVTGIINNSKSKGEAIFVEKLSDAIDEYISLNGDSLAQSDVDTSYKFKKCYMSNCYNEDNDSYDEDSYYEVKAVLLDEVSISELLDEELLNEEDIVNPSNKLNCLNDGKNPLIKIYKDDDYVYYYYVDLSGDNTSCEISTENGIINTLPDNLFNVIRDSGGFNNEENVYN